MQTVLLIQLLFKHAASSTNTPSHTHSRHDHQSGSSKHHQSDMSEDTIPDHIAVCIHQRFTVKGAAIQHTHLKQLALFGSLKASRSAHSCFLSGSQQEMTMASMHRMSSMTHQLQLAPSSQELQACQGPSLGVCHKNCKHQAQQQAPPTSPQVCRGLPGSLDRTNL